MPTRCAHKEPDALKAGRVVPSYCKPVVEPVDMNSCRNGWMDTWDRLPVDRLVQRPCQDTAISVLSTESLKHYCLVQVMQQLGVLGDLLPHEEPGDRVAFVTPGFSTMASFFTNPVRLPTPSGFSEDTSCPCPTSALTCCTCNGKVGRIPPVPSPGKP